VSHCAPQHKHTATLHWSAVEGSDGDLWPLTLVRSSVVIGANVDNVTVYGRRTGKPERTFSWMKSVLSLGSLAPVVLYEALDADAHVERAGWYTVEL